MPPTGPMGPRIFFRQCSTTLAKELNRYDRVIYLESAAKDAYVANLSKNPNRTETWEEAESLDQRTKSSGPSIRGSSVIRNERSFGMKISEVLELIKTELDRQK